MKKWKYRTLISIRYEKFYYQNGRNALTVIIEDSNFHDRDASQLDIVSFTFTIKQRHLKKEFFVRFPLIIIYNFDHNLGNKIAIIVINEFYKDRYLFLRLIRLKREDFIDFNVVFVNDCSSINRFNPEKEEKKCRYTYGSNTTVKCDSLPDADPVIDSPSSADLYWEFADIFHHSARRWMKIKDRVFVGLDLNF